MYFAESSERLAEALIKARKDWERSPPAGRLDLNVQISSLPAFTIAFSQEAGASGSLIAHAVGERLGWPVYEREGVQQIAESLGEQANLRARLDEKHSAALQEFLNTQLSRPAVEDSAFMRAHVQTLLLLATRGECIIVGRGAAQLLPFETTVRVRVIAPLENRIASVGRRFNVPREEAIRRVATTDRYRSRFVEEHFGKDPADPRFYDLVLNSSRLSVDACAELVVATLRHLQARMAFRTPQLVNVQ
jgi:cytidylate kinase